MRIIRRGVPLLLGLLAAGCGEEIDAAERDLGRRAGSVPVEPLVVVVAEDSSVSSPGRLSSGSVGIRFFNRGSEPHHIRLVHLASERSPAELRDRLLEDGRLPDWAQAVGGSGTFGPGAEAEDRVRLNPGMYVLLCSRISANRRTHLARGMIRVLRVDGAAPVGTDVSLPMDVSR